MDDRCSIFFNHSVRDSMSSSAMNMIRLSLRHHPHHPDSVWLRFRVFGCRALTINLHGPHGHDRQPNCSSSYHWALTPSKPATACQAVTLHSIPMCDFMFSFRAQQHLHVHVQILPPGCCLCGRPAPRRVWLALQKSVQVLVSQYVHRRVQIN